MNLGFTYKSMDTEQTITLWRSNTRSLFKDITNYPVQQNYYLLSLQFIIL